jgi:hypothetical protein
VIASTRDAATNTAQVGPNNHDVPWCSIGH